MIGVSKAVMQIKGVTSLVPGTFLKAKGKVLGRKLGCNPF